MRYIFYYEHGCLVCSEVESVLESWLPKQYRKIRYSKSHIPGKSVIHLPDGPEVVDSETIPAVPALYDQAAQTLYVGDRSIYGFLRVEGEA